MFKTRIDTKVSIYFVYSLLQYFESVDSGLFVL